MFMFRAGSIVIMLVLAAAFFSGKAMAQERENQGKTEVATSMNVEMICTVLNLTDSWDERHTEFRMAVKAREIFLPFKDHAAVSATKVFMKKGWWHLYYCYLALYLSDFPEAALLVDPSDPRIGRLLSVKLAGYVSALRDFYSDAKYYKYWIRERKAYEKLRKKIEKKVRGIDIAGILERFYGTSMDHYVIMPVTQLPDMSLHVERDSDRQRYAFCLFGPQSGDKGFDYDKKDLTADFIFHEFSYSFLEPLVRKHDSLLMNHSYIYEKVKDAMAEKGHLSWGRVFSENLIRAIRTRLAGKAFGQKVTPEVLHEEIEAGYELVPVFDGILDLYEQDRARYTTFDDFMPELFTQLGRRITPDWKSENGGGE
ncbi:MAG: DUF4932 domain-containing protein [Candidatus Zixiibacteriota bacterium]|nr:MAG: DUF4932 domain-containing protein [candidate division Zixibacteria bacterium]